MNMDLGCGWPGALPPQTWLSPIALRPGFGRFQGLFLPFDGPRVRREPHPTGTLDLFNPPFVAPNDVTLQNGPISTNDPWLPAARRDVGNTSMRTSTLPRPMDSSCLG